MIDLGTNIENRDRAIIRNILHIYNLTIFNYNFDTGYLSQSTNHKAQKEKPNAKRKLKNVKQHRFDC